MRYIIYIDKLILMVFIFHILQLMIAKRFFLCTATRRKIFLSAIAGTFLFYVLFGLINGTILFRIAASCSISDFFVILFCFWHGSKWKCLKLFLVSANGIFVIFACLTCLLRQAGWALWGLTLIQIFLLFFNISSKRVVYCERKMAADSNKIVEVSLPGKEGIITVKALLDSGNSLYEPLSAAPVSLITSKLADQMSDVFLYNTYRVVPYQSVGCKKGYLESYRIPFIIIHLELEDHKISNPVIAITVQGLDDNSHYQMILHPDLFIRRTDYVIESGRKRKRNRAICRTK